MATIFPFMATDVIIEITGSKNSLYIRNSQQSDQDEYGFNRQSTYIFIERLWRSLKYEDIYLKGYSSMPELINGIDNYIKFYNFERPH